MAQKGRGRRSETRRSFTIAHDVWFQNGPQDPQDRETAITTRGSGTSAVGRQRRWARRRFSWCSGVLRRHHREWPHAGSARIRPRFVARIAGVAGGRRLRVRRGPTGRPRRPPHRWSAENAQPHGRSHGRVRTAS